MSTPKHTPGPWTVYKAGSFKILFDKSSNSEIGQLSCTESEANLIAAAPEMLEALIQVESELIDADLEVPKYIERAIKKAKGES